MRKIPATGESLPALGMGTWKTFDVPAGPDRKALAGVLDPFFTSGCRLIDTSPMYGMAEAALGETLAASPRNAAPFIATKVWTRGRAEGIRQMEGSFRLLCRPVLDLMQVHNLVDWRTHVPVLKEWKAAGRIRYWGLTHYTASSQGELLRVAAETRPDFIQINYSLAEPDAEADLLPFAMDNGIAVLANRPFGEGSLFARARGKPLPGSAREAGYKTWGAVALGFVLGNPAVTCAIPATSNPLHLAENIAAASLPLPDAALRRAWREGF